MALTTHKQSEGWRRETKYGAAVVLSSIASLQYPGYLHCNAVRAETDSASALALHHLRWHLPA